MVALTDLRPVREQMHRLQFQLGKFRFGNSESLQYGTGLLQATQSTLEILYDHLIAPVRPLLKTSHLVIAPHGCAPLSSFPCLAHRQ